MSVIQNLKKNIKRYLPTLFGGLSNLKASLLKILVNAQRTKLRERITNSHRNNPEAEEVLTFLKDNEVHMIPYPFIKEYEGKEISLKKNASGFWYTEVNNNPIYFPAHMSESYIKEALVNAFLEQDERSPHRYLPTKKISIGGDIAILCGASDGIYTLEIVNNFNRVYLFEADTRWIEPLRLTLKDYLHKVEIVPLYISSENTKSSITIDSFLKDKPGQVNYLQADIENAEFKMLMGASNLLDTAKNLKMSLCCYHTDIQEKELDSLLRKYGFETSTSPGYLLLWMQYPLRAPYLRRGVIYAQKN
jgi:Methyltransferase FkbM domain